MRDRSKQLLVINTGKKESEQTRLPAQSGTTHIIGGGGLSVNMSDYLLKSIWDKVFEIRTDGQGTEYIFGKLPMVTQYGITMYSGDGVDIPSLASGLPFDGRTIWYNPDTQQIEVIGGTGGGSGEGVSNFWDLSGIPSWITISKPKYTYSEIEGTPDLSKYALASQIPSLSGYATESWVLQKNYATKATTLRGYGITDAYTKTNVDDLLKSYVTLGGTQTITGEKNFTGGLKVNGSPIYYDSTKKYWKLEGDLLVTGGVTMYGSDSSFTPSTIMDAILYDDATLGINSNGQLYVKGGTGGGLDITALQNYLTSKSYLNVTGGDNRYLQLSGGTITGSLEIKCGADNKIIINNTDGEGYSRIVFQENGSYIGQLLSTKDGNINWGESKIWHSANFNPSNYLPLSGGTMTGNILLGGTTTNKIGTNIVDTSGGFQELTHQNSNGYIALGPFNGSVAHIYTDRPSFYFNKDLYVNNAKVWHAGNDGAGSGLDADLLDGQDGSWHRQNVISFRRVNYTSSLVHDANVAINGMLYNYGSNTYWRNTPDMSYGQILTLKSYGNNELMGQLAWDIRHGESDTTRYLWWRAIQNESTISNAKWHQIAFTDSNVTSATKLQTARTIWGQSFDGTGNVVGSLTNAYTISYNTTTNGYLIGHRAYYFGDGVNGLVLASMGDNPITFATRATEVMRISYSGNVGIGTESPVSKCDINGLLSIRLESSSAPQSSLNLMNTSSDLWQLSARYGTSDNGNFNIYYYNGSTWANPISINKNGNLLATGAMTFYSMRKLKNVVDERGLSLNELSTIKPTRYTWKDGRDNRLHFGGIADDIQQVLPEVVYNTSDGILTMDYGNAAFAVASSLIRPVVDHEKRIAMLEEENKQLRLEIERLKAS